MAAGVKKKSVCVTCYTWAARDTFYLQSEDKFRKLGYFGWPSQLQRTVWRLPVGVCFCMPPNVSHRVNVWTPGVGGSPLASPRPTVPFNSCQPRSSLMTGVHIQSVSHKHTEWLRECVKIVLMEGSIERWMEVHERRAMSCRCSPLQHPHIHKRWSTQPPLLSAVSAAFKPLNI